MPESTTKSLKDERELPSALRWRSWPLLEGAPWSWSMPLGIIAVGVGVSYAIANWFLGVMTAIGLTATLGQFLLPTEYEITPMGLSRHTLGRRKIIPWQAVQSYRPRETGIVLFQRLRPTPIDALRVIFLPYGDAPDETLSMLRKYLQHAEELSS